jgi:hypothetical protein
VKPLELLDTVLRMPARGLTNIAFPLELGSELARAGLARARHGTAQLVRTRRDVAPALGRSFGT